jgi:COMPASS component SWD3
MVWGAAADRTVKVWHTSSGALVRDFVGHSQGVSDVAWSDQSEFIASASDDGTVRLWDLEEVSGVVGVGAAAC